MNELTRRREQALNARASDVQAGTRTLVDTLARAAFERFWALLVANPALEVQAAVALVQAEFGGAFAQGLAAAFSTLLERSVGTAQALALPVGEITLSRKLFLHAQTVQGEVTALVRQHAQGVTQARALALRLYDGYDPQDGIRRPLEGSARGQLPKALRALTADRDARESLSALVERGQAQASRLKSRALRAAYEEAFDAWRDGAGQEALQRKLDNALREKNRHFADRIAQTELAKAHQAEVAAGFMADDQLEVVQVRLNPRHPLPDICDLHAGANLYGLGPGCYPKAKAPRPPYHPRCWCRLSSRPDLYLNEARRVGDPASEARAYLASLPPAQAARVLGSRDRLERALRGESISAVVNAGKEPVHWTQVAGGGAWKVAGQNGGVSPSEIADFAKKAMGVSDQKLELDLGPVKNADQIRSATGLDLSGYSRMLDNYGVRHTMKQHGSTQKEALRGQVAVSLDDFGMIPLITSEPDRVFLDGKNKIGRDVIVFTKTIEGVGYRHVEEVRSRKRLVATDSLRKKKGPWGA